MPDYIRQPFGLWDGNTALTRSCACDSPDDAATVMIEGVECLRLIKDKAR